MSDTSAEPWSDNRYAPQIPLWAYIGEKSNLAGTMIGAMSYGVVVVLFFHCMGALLDPTNRTNKGIKWALVAHTVATFLFVTVATGMNFDYQSIAYIDNREFPGTSGHAPGPIGYQDSIFAHADNVVPNIMFLLNTCLTDGLLLYRCYLVYTMNYWVVVIPCLMYLTSLAMGITLVYQTSQPLHFIRNAITFDFGIPYFSIALAFNILVTLMIVLRLVFHTRDFRKATGVSAGSDGIYKAVLTMFIESCALYAVSFICFFASWGINSPAAFVTFPILVETQVIAPFLIILRVANRRALTTNAAAPGKTSSIRFGSRGKLTDGSGTLFEEHPMSSIGTGGDV